MRLKLIGISIVALSGLSATADSKTCEPGFQSNRFLVQKTLNLMAKDPKQTVRSEAAGSLSFSVLPAEFADVTTHSHVLRLRVRRYFLHFADGKGTFVDQSSLTFKTNADCTGYEAPSIETHQATPDFKGDEELSRVTRVAFLAITSDPSNIPINRHSSSHTLRFHIPTRCTNRDLYSVSVVRTNHQPTGIASKVFTYLIDKIKMEVIEADQSPGRLLKSLCN